MLLTLPFAWVLCESYSNLKDYVRFGAQFELTQFWLTSVLLIGVLFGTSEVPASCGDTLFVAFFADFLGACFVGEDLLGDLPATFFGDTFDFGDLEGDLEDLEGDLESFFDLFGGEDLAFVECLLFCFACGATDDNRERELATMSSTAALQSRLD